jgi:trehalose 6-phosphate synthase
LGVGVDRVDYTKGIIERFRGIERFIEMNPAYQRRFTFVQIGAPSRTDIPRYQQFLDEVSAVSGTSHARLQTGNGSPSYCSENITPTRRSPGFYHAASLCLVSSLHDGMNLVARNLSLRVTTSMAC